MRIGEEDFFPFVSAMQKTLTASINIQKLDARNFRCVISLHNPTESDFAFHYVVNDMNFCEFLIPFDQERNSLQEAGEHDGEVHFVIHRQKIRPFFRDWKVKRIKAGGVQRFEIPIWQDERVVGEKAVKFLHIGKKKMFWIGEATKIDLLFGYYRLESESVPLPLDLQSENNPDATE